MKNMTQHIKKPINEMRCRLKVTFLLCCVILLACGLIGFYQIDKESLFIDEAASLFYAQHDIVDIPDLVFRQGHAPLYFILLRWWMSLFGYTIFVARTFSCVFYIFSSLLVFHLGRALLKDDKTAFIGAFLFFTNTTQIYYAQEIRMYAMNVFFAVGSFYLLVLFLQEDKKKYLVSYAITSIVFISLHLFNIFIIVAQIVVLMLKEKKFAVFLKKYAGICGLQLVVFFIWFSLVSRGQDINALAVLNQPQSFFSGVFHLVNWLSFRTYTEFVLDRLSEYTLFHIAGMYFLLIMAFWGGYLLAKKNRQSVWLCSVWFGVPIVSLVVISLLAGISGYSSGIFVKVRYILAAGVPYYLLCAYGLRDILDRKIFFFLPLFLGIGILINAMDYYRIDKKSNWEEVFTFIERNRLSDEVVGCISYQITTQLPVEYFVGKYYLPSSFMLITPDSKERLLEDDLVGGIWYIAWNAPYTLSTFARWVEADFSVQGEKKVDNIHVVHFRRDE